MSTAIGYGSLTRELGRRIPFLREAVEQQLFAAGGEDPGPHVVFGDVFNPWLEECLSKPEAETDLGIAFQFLEDMALDPDPRVQEVVQMTVLEDLLASPDLLKRARALMGPAARELSRQIEGFWDRVREESGGTP